MDTFESDLRLHAIAVAARGTDGLDSWLREQLQRYPQLSALFKNDVWLRVDAGQIVERLCRISTTAGMYFESVMPTGTDLQHFRDARSLLFNNLLLALPIEQLTEDLREQRLALDLGL
jgi:hypothetical protein